MALMQQAGLKTNRLTNIWMPFVVASATKLVAGGRLALVAPAELLQVSYAAQLRSFLAERFSRIEIIACNHLFFEYAEQEVVLLLADGFRESAPGSAPCAIDLVETDSVRSLAAHRPVQLASKGKLANHESEKWTRYFLSAREISFMRSLRTAEVVAPLGHHAAVDIGVVTGKNQFFVVSREEVQRFGLDGCTVPLVARAAHLKGAALSAAEWKRLSVDGERVYLLYLNGRSEEEFGDGLREYIRQGELAGHHAGYKCSIRTPWYKVPSTWVPELFLFRQIYDFPRPVVNRAGATSTDTIHRLRFSGNAAALARNLYTHLTAASAEIEGRSYGGGVLELEPNEAERVLAPRDLHKAIPLAEIDSLVRRGRIADVLCRNDKAVLMDGLGLTRAECDMLRAIWVKMRDRRRARTRSAGP
jgi:adenine-specific DNA methylase